MPHLIPPVGFLYRREYWRRRGKAAKAVQDFADGFWRMDDCHNAHPAKTARALQNVQLCA